MRRPWWGVIPCLLLAGAACAQDARPADAVALLEDETEVLVTELNNSGNADASVAQRTEAAPFTGAAALEVTEFQRFTPAVPGWRFVVVENPRPGEFRYLRFAWKRTEAPGIMLQLHAVPGAWHRYYAGAVSEKTQAWGAMLRVGEAPPREWTVVTRDLFKDFGPLTLTGAGFSALEGPGAAYYDHIYLGRSIADLDRVTAAKRGEPGPAPAAPPESGTAGRGWLLLAAGGGTAGLLLLAAGLYWWTQRSAKPAAGDPGKRPAGVACPACGKSLRLDPPTPGRRVKCPGCGHVFAPA